MFKVAFIGAGSMALEHARVFSAIEGVTLSGIYSRTKKRAEDLCSKFNIGKVSESISKLYENSQPDLVIIAVPELEANSIAKECLKYPWALFMEKPAGYNLSDAQDIYQASVDASNKVFVGLNRRFYSSVQYISENLLNEQDKRYVHIQDQQSFEEARFYKQPEEVVQNFMYANSIHTIDLLTNFCRGSLVKVNPVIPWVGEASEVVLAHLEYDSGDIGLYEGLWKGPGPWSCSVSTPSARWVLQPLEQVRYQQKGKRQQQEVPIDALDVEYKPGFYKQAVEIIKSLKGEENKAVTLADSLKTMHTINKIFGV